MAYNISWIVPSRILSMKLEGEVTIDEMKALVAETHAFVNEGRAPVHAVIDATQLVNRPVNFQEITHISTTMQNPAVGWWILINAGKMVMFTTSILSRLLQVKFKAAENFDEAMSILEHVDPTLKKNHQTQSLTS